MRCLEALAPRVEQYSIDEMFLDVAGIDNCVDFEDFGRQLREYVHRHTALTIGVGGPSKTLAKSAQWLQRVAAVWRRTGFDPDNPRRTEKLLSLQPVEEIWVLGAGSRS
ncbi:DNA polymerase IV [Klebsiella pneumoniae]|nr:DNA polymerase IV [Klebsiella pneumoniae]